MKWKRIFIPRVETIFLIAIFCGITASGPRLLNIDGDLPRHLLVGQLTLQTAKVSTIDIFSFRTGNFPSYPHEWLSQVLFSIPYIIFGLNGVVLMVSALITLTFAFVYKNVRQKASPLVALVCTGLALSASTIHILPRPHLFTYFLIALWLCQTERLHTGKSNKWWILPVLMLPWVNMHGMFVIGLLIWLAYLVGDILEYGNKAWKCHPGSRLVLTGGLVSLPVTFLYPPNAGIWEAVVGIGGNSYIAMVTSEYQSANFHLPGMWPFIFMLALLIVGLSLNKKQLPWPHILLVVGFTILALYSSRMIPIFAIVTAPIIAELLSNWLHKNKRQSRLEKLEALTSAIEKQASGIFWIFATILIIILSFIFQLFPQSNEFDKNVFPVDAVKWLNEHPQTGHMFNDFNWGSYILFKTWPKYQIFMDGHTHIFGETLTREYEQVLTTNPGWESILDKYQIEWTIIPTTSRLANTFEQEGWTILYEDQTAVILRK